MTAGGDDHAQVWRRPGEGCWAGCTAAGGPAAARRGLHNFAIVQVCPQAGQGAVPVLSVPVLSGS